MRISTVATVVVVLALVLPTAAGAGQYTGPGFSGVVWFGESGRADQELGRMHVDRAGVRMDVEQGGQRMAVLAYWDDGTTFTLMLDQRLFLEIPAQEARATTTSFAGRPCDGYEDARRIGAETVNGRQTEKWRCIGKLAPTPGEQPEDSTSWFDPQVGFPIRETRDNGEVFEVRDIVVARQNAALFEVPDGYRKLDMNALMQQAMERRQNQ